MLPPSLTGSREWVVPELPGRPFGARQHARWLEILRGTAPSDPTAEDGLASLLVSEALQRSAAAGREEPVAA